MTRAEARTLQTLQALTRIGHRLLHVARDEGCPAALVGGRRGVLTLTLTHPATATTVRVQWPANTCN
jgi:hypothetical protein